MEKIYRLYPFLVLFTAALTAAISVARAESVLSLDQYLYQVDAKNPLVASSNEGTVAGTERSEDASLIFLPTLYGNAQLESNAQLPQIPIYSYEKIVTNTYSLGVSEQTTFGLLAKLHYDITYTSFVNTFIPGQGAVNVPPFYQTTPVLELSMPLLGNGFGRTVRANRDLIEAQALASSYNNRYQKAGAMVDAETAYWRLSAARQSIKVTTDGLERARKIYEWSKRRANLHLADEADALQAEALVKVRELELQTANDDARVASRTFNLARNLDSDVVTEELLPPDSGVIAKLRLPPESTLPPGRDDVRAAAENAKAAEANAKIAYEKDTPTFDLYGSYALNSNQDQSLAPSLTDPYNVGRPTRAVGVRFSVPLAVGTASHGRDGWTREQSSADLAYQKKVIDEQQGWKDLTERFTEARRRLELATAIESAQKIKLQHEKDRLAHGRTTTYQVLLFEEDFDQAQVNRIGAERDALTLFAQTKLYGEEK